MLKVVYDIHGGKLLHSSLSRLGINQGKESANQ